MSRNRRVTFLLVAPFLIAAGCPDDTVAQGSPPRAGADPRCSGPCPRKGVERRPAPPWAWRSGHRPRGQPAPQDVLRHAESQFLSNRISVGASLSSFAGFMRWPAEGRCEEGSETIGDPVRSGGG